MATPWLISRLITPPMTEMNTLCSTFWGLPLQKLNWGPVATAGIRRGSSPGRSGMSMAPVSAAGRIRASAPGRRPGRPTDAPSGREQHAGHVGRAIDRVVAKGVGLARGTKHDLLMRYQAGKADGVEPQTALTLAAPATRQGFVLLHLKRIERLRGPPSTRRS